MVLRITIVIIRFLEPIDITKEFEKKAKIVYKFVPLIQHANEYTTT